MAPKGLESNVSIEIQSQTQTVDSLAFPVLKSLLVTDSVMRVCVPVFVLLTTGVMHRLLSYSAWLLPSIAIEYVCFNHRGIAIGFNVDWPALPVLASINNGDDTVSTAVGYVYLGIF